MSKVTIVTDSTAYIPQNYLDQYDIQIVPLTVIFGEETFSDGVDMSPAQFYDRLAVSPVMPTTSQVVVQAFQEIFEQGRDRGDEILVITISSKLSGTFESAEQARALVPDGKIELVDSLGTTVMQGMIILAAARKAAEGGSLLACKQAAEAARERTSVIFAVNTLEFLHRGGRIGGAKRFMATVLNIKPILMMHEGRVDGLEQARTRKKSINRLIEIVAERVEGKQDLILAVSHANAPDEAEKFLEAACARLDPVESFITELSPVIGTHAGPGTLAIAYDYAP